jgi:hypothetical protein
MPVVPMTPQQPRRQTRPQADPKFLLMAAAMMHNEGKFKPQPNDRSEISGPSSDPSAALQSTQPQGMLK